MKLTALGEFGLIAALAKIISSGPSGADRLLVGIGDDAAVWRTGAGAEIATTDMLLEGVHFTLETTSWFDLGWKSVAVNLSDIAAMGGEPRYALIGLGLPPSSEVCSIEDFYRGAVALAGRFSTTIAGGDTVRSLDRVAISVMVIGEAKTEGGAVRLLRRSEARIGDQVAVTGTVGGSAGGLETFRRQSGAPSEVVAGLREAHLRPVPRAAEAQVLLASGVVAAMDVSDGLVGDLEKLCLASGTAAIVDLPRVPVSPLARQAFPSRALELALYGGEDYELLFTGPPQVISEAADRLRSQGFAAATVIGEIVDGPAGKVWLCGKGGGLSEPSRGGYDAYG